MRSIGMEGVTTVLLGLIASPGLAQGRAPSAAEFTRGFGPEVVSGFARVRAATAAFVSLDSAVAAGYQRESAQCFADEHHGAMGFHHTNRAYFDNQLDLERPEILLYEKQPDGRYALNGVEFILPYRFWPRDSVAPTLMGLPLNQENQRNYWYLHMWVWNLNPSGLFADWNPKVRCPVS
jgi:hypothetical protein